MEKQKYFGSEALSRLANIVNAKDTALKADIDTKADTTYVDSRDRGHDLAISDLEAKDRTLNQSIEQVKSELDLKIDNTKNELDIRDNELSEDIKQAKIDINDRIDRVKSELDTKDGALETAIEQVKADLNTKIDGVETDLNDKILKKGTADDPYDKLYAKKIEIDNTDYRNPIVIKNRNPLDVCTNLNADMLDGHDYDEIQNALDTKANTTYVDEQILAAKDEIFGGAEGTYSTIKEIKEYIQEHQDVFEALSASVKGKADKIYVDAELSAKADRDWVSNKLDTEYYNKSAIAEQLRSKMDAAEANRTFQTKTAAEAAEKTLKEQIDDKVSIEEGKTYVKLDGSREMTGTLKAYRGVDVGNTGIYKAEEGMNVSVGGQLEYHFGSETFEPLQAKNDLGTATNPWDTTYTNRVVVKATSGTPIAVETKELCTNLNADLLDGHEYSEIDAALATKATKTELNTAKGELDTKINTLRSDTEANITAAKDECKNYTDIKFDALVIPDNSSIREDVSNLKTRVSSLEQNCITKSDLADTVAGLNREHDLLDSKISDVKTSLTEEIQARKDDIKEANTKLTDVTTRVASLEGDIPRIEASHETIQNKTDKVETDYKAAVKAVETEYKAADSALKAEDARIESAYQAADASIDAAYKAADRALETAYQAADKAIETAYQAADSSILSALDTEVNTRKSEVTRIESAYKSADNAIITDYKKADEVLEQGYQSADAVLESSYKAADAMIETAYKAADAAIDAAYKAADKDITTAYKTADAALKSAYELADSEIRANLSDLKTTVNNNQKSCTEGLATVNNTLTQALENEAELRRIGDEKLTSDLQKEITRATNVENELHNEIQDRPTKDSVENLVRAEVLNIIGGNGDWTNLIDVLKYINEHGDLIIGLQNSIDQEVQNRIAGDNNIKKLLWDDTRSQIIFSETSTVRDAFDTVNNTINTTKSDLEGKIKEGDDAIKNILAGTSETKFDTTNTVRSAIEKVRIDCAGEDTAIRSEFASADNQVRSEFASADEVLEAAYKAGDEALEAAYKAADSSIESAYKAGDEAIKAMLARTTGDSPETQFTSTDTVRGNIEKLKTRCTTIENKFKEYPNKEETELLLLQLEEDLKGLLWTGTETDFRNAQGRTVSGVIAALAERVVTLENENSALKAGLNGALTRITALENRIPNAVVDANGWDAYLHNTLKYLKYGDTISHAEYADNAAGMENLDIDHIAYTNKDNRFTVFQTFTQGAGKNS